MADRWSFTRTQLDEFALSSHAAAARSQDAGEFDAEIEQCIRGAVRIGLADGDLALLAVTDGDGDMTECALYLLGRGGGA